MIRVFLFFIFLPLVTAAESAWPTYGSDPGGRQFADIEQITPDNVARLTEVWRYRTGDDGAGFSDPDNRAFEATPILIGRTLYLSTPFGQIHAIDAANGELKWKFDTAPPKDRDYSEHTSRGVSYWRDEFAPPATRACLSRIFFGTRDARLVALDALTGEPCEDFGEGGEVDLNEGSRPKWPGNYLITSPPVVYRNLVITGSAVGDNGAVDLEYGIVRALDARTGDLVWAWDPIPRDGSDPAAAEWQPDQLARTGAANAWSILSLDPELGNVYIPTGSASPDFYGGERLGDNRHANSVVALDASTGELVWARQLVHHDVWDYDMPAQPTLVDLRRGNETIPALVQLTKMGMLFVLDRRTGEPVFDIEERPVPQNPVAGEVLSKTQPFSSIPPFVSHAAITEDDAWGLLLLDRWHCQRQMRRYRSEGIYTPPSLEGTIMTPAWTGGGNWGGVAFEPSRQYAVAFVMDVPAVIQLLPREVFNREREDPTYPDSEYTAQRGTPYGMRRGLLTSFLGVPCTAPPWGLLVATDLASGEIAWRVPVGTTSDFAPWPFDDIPGMVGIGGPMVTSSGLVFIGAVLEHYLRAFDLESGDELWKARLPAGAQTTPMTYELDGRQYVVTVAGGYGGMGTELSDHVIAFALPDR